MTNRQDEWLWGWDPTPGIVSVWAQANGNAFVWRRVGSQLELIREDLTFRPWILLASLADLAHLGPRLTREGQSQSTAGTITYEELDGAGELRYLVRGNDGRALANAVLRGASQRLGRAIKHLRELPGEQVFALPPEEQYLVSSGQTYFRDLGFDDLCRMQFDLETTGLNPEVDRVFLIALRDAKGQNECLEAIGESDAAEADLLHRFVATMQAWDPDVVENHNLHGFDLPFLAHRAQRLNVRLELGRSPARGLYRRPAARGAAWVIGEGESAPSSRVRSRFTTAGREWIDTLDAVRRYDFSVRELSGHGLKAVAKHLRVAGPEREYIAGAQIHDVYRRDPARVRRYALDDVNEVAAIARILGGSAFALAKMAPRRYERLADAGPATGVLDPLLVRAYLRSGAALPVHDSGDGTVHSGAALHLFATGVARRVVKADVASLYPSLMREYRIGPRRDRLGVLLALVDRLVELRLSAKAKARLLPSDSAEHHGQEALSAAMKIVVNSAYGYLGAVGLTRFSDVHAANEVTRRGRELLHLLCHELQGRGVTLLEADTDGVYFAVPSTCSEHDERDIVAQVASLLPSRVRLEFEGRYFAMLSHEPKNYALLPYQGPLILRGVAFRSSRAEPFGEAFLRKAIGCLLRGDILGVRQAYLDTVQALQRRTLPTFDVSALVRLTKTPAQYMALRGRRRELSYEALLAQGKTMWRPGERIRVYRASGGRAGWWQPDEGGDESRRRANGDRCDYDVDYYLRVLKDSFAARLVRAFHGEDFAQLFANPQQLSLFDPLLHTIQPILTVLSTPATHGLP